MKNVTDQDFKKDILESQNLSVVDFWAEWCGPCKILGPSIDALSKEYEGQVNIRKLNVDENPETPAKYHIRGIPTVLFFRGGELIDQIVGAVPKDVLDSTIQKHLKH